MLSQEEIKAMILPLMEQYGRKYKKNKHVLAKKAETGERIATITGDGLETVNEAEQGDFIIQNMTEAGEHYLISEEDFRKKYHYLRRAGAGYSEYKSIGEIYAIALDKVLLERLHLPDVFYFQAAWGAEMVAKAGDFLAAPPDFGEVYRIAEKEFYETYEEGK